MVVALLICIVTFVPTRLLRFQISLPFFLGGETLEMGFFADGVLVGLL
jgi:hypothetical protein